MKSNYHTHTTRCNHAEGYDEDYVIAAIEAGYQVLGFSDHSPWPKHPLEHQFIRMKVDEIEDYVQSIHRLKRQYSARIQILCGLEAEYYPERIEYLKDLVEKYQLDYLILGNHFRLFESRGTYFGSYADENKVIQDYTELSIQALRSGLYKIFAHPDVFLRSLSSFSEEAIAASRLICEVAKEEGVVMEYNLRGIGYKRKDLDYPFTPFWKIVQEVGNDVIIGVDAHSPSDFDNDSILKEAQRLLKELGIKVIEMIDII